MAWCCALMGHRAPDWCHCGSSTPHFPPTSRIPVKKNYIHSWKSLSGALGRDLAFDEAEGEPDKRWGKGMRTKKGGLFSRTAWTKWISSTSMSHAQNGCLVFVLFHQLLLRPERWVMIMSSAWISLFLLKRAVYVKPASPCVKLWPVSSCDNDVTVTPQSPPFLPCYLRLSNLFVPACFYPLPGTSCSRGWLSLQTGAEFEQRKHKTTKYLFIFFLKMSRRTVDRSTSCVNKIPQRQ